MHLLLFSVGIDLHVAASISGVQWVSAHATSPNLTQASCLAATMTSQRAAYLLLHWKPLYSSAGFGCCNLMNAPPVWLSVLRVLGTSHQSPCMLGAQFMLKLLEQHASLGRRASWHSCRHRHLRSATRTALYFVTC